jgi:hypothetical protein
MAKFKGGTVTHRKGYLRIKAGPLRDCLVHRIVAAALIGRDLDKSEEAHHLDANRLNCHWSNLIVLGNKDHGWVSAKQSWYMREKDAREKANWDEFMKEKEKAFIAEITAARGEGVPWQMTRVDGELQVEWEARQQVGRQS